MVYQHFTLVENMSVVENIVMARGHLPAVINWKAETEQLRAFMDTMPFRVDPTAIVRNISAGEKQKVEILKQDLTFCSGKSSSSTSRPRCSRRRRRTRF